MASHDEQISRFWDDLFRSGQPAAEPELDTGLTQAIQRFQHQYAVSPPESTRERVRQRVLQSQSTSHEMESAMNLDAAILPPMSANGRIAPLPIPQRPTAPRSRWFDSHWSLIQAVAALLLLAGLIGGIFIYAQGDRGSHPAVAPATPPATPASSWLQYRNGPAHLGVAANPGPSTLPLDLWNVPTQGAINSEPAIADGVLYIGSEDGHLYALDTSTGGQNWAFDAGSSVDTSPTIGNALVYATDRNATLHAIDLATGASAWTFASANPNAAATLAGDVLYVAGDDTNLYALDPAKGTILWSFDTGANTGRTPAVANGVVYLGTESGQLFAVDAATGQRTWVFSGATGTAGSTVVDGATVYQSFIHGSDDRLYALDAATGAELWSFGTPTKDTVWVPAVSGNTLYAPSNDGNIYALDTKTGAIRWQFTAEGPAEASGVLDDSTFYVAGDAGYLYALDRETGIERWSLQVDDGATKGPALIDGVLYLGTTLGVVHAFAGPEPNVIGAPETAATPIPSTPSAQNAPADLVWSIDESNSPFGTAGGLSVDPEGRLWLFDSSDTIFILGADGSVVDTWSDDFNFTQGDGDVYGNAVFANNGDIYILDAGTNRILKFDAQRNPLTSWGGFGNGDGQFRSLLALAIAPNGDILAADDAQRRIQVFDPDGIFLTSWETNGDFADVVIGPDGHVYGSSACEVVVWDSSGKELDRWAASDSRSCSHLSGLELNSDGTLFVSVSSSPYDAGVAAIAVFDTAGKPIIRWNPRLDPANSTDFDDAFTLDSAGNLYVLDYFEGTIAKFALHAPLTPATPAAG